MIARGAISAWAPGRVELLGNHTDYNEGVVLGAAINRVVRVDGRRNDRLIHVASSGFGKIQIQAGELRSLQNSRWANYVLGVAYELRRLGMPMDGFTAEISGDLSIGSGLSS